MTTHKIPTLTPSLSHPRRFANNGQVPPSAALAKLAYGIDYWAQHAGKLIAFQWDDLNDPFDPSSGSRVASYAWTIVGPACSAIKCLIGLAKASNAGASDPYVYITYVNRSTGASADSDEIHYAANDTGTAVVAPSDIFHGKIILDGLTPGVEYELSLNTANFARPIYWVAYEHNVETQLDDTLDGVVSPAPWVTEGPIMATDVQKYLEACTDLHQKGGQHLGFWAGAMDASTPAPEQTTSSTWTDCTKSWEHEPDLAYRGTVMRPGVQVVFAAVGKTSASGAAATRNGFRIVDADSGALLAACTGWKDSTQWRRVIVRLPEGTQAYECEYISDGTNTLSVYGWTVLDWGSSLPTLAPSHSLDLETSSSQYVSIADSDQTGLALATDATLACWVRLESLPGSGVTYPLISKWTATGNQRSYELRLVNTGGTHTVRMMISDDGTNTHSREFTWTPSTATWYHLAFTFDASGSGIANQFAGYLDGASQTLATVSDDGSTSIFDSTTLVGIGVSPDIANTFDGLIHSAQIWSRPLSASEVDTIYDNELVGTLMSQPQTDLEGWWLVHDDLGDKTANGNTMTATNTPVFSATVP